MCLRMLVFVREEELIKATIYSPKYNEIVRNVQNNNAIKILIYRRVNVDIDFITY